LGDEKRKLNKKNMNKLLVILSLFFMGSFSFGQNTEQINGDLYFGLWRYGSFYKQPKKVIEWVDNLSTTTRRDTLDKTSQNILRIYDDLKKEELLYNPYIQMILPNDTVVRIYLLERDYRKIRKNKIDDLQEKNEKVTLELEVKQIGSGLYYCEKIINMNRIQGKTFGRQSKFKIEDYP